MKTISYTTIDKSSWPRGPWDSEPDKIQWPDEETGLPCIARRAGAALGHWCGYVGVAEDNPCFGKGCEDIDVEVHGGLTFAEACAEGDPETSIYHIPNPDEPDHIWWFGFDCAHSGDRMPGMESLMPDLGRISRDSEYRTLDFVQRECKSLAKQLANYKPK